MQKTYRFIGPGKGIPGLPHTLTEAEVMRLGVEILLADALKYKQYEVIQPTEKEKPAIVITQRSAQQDKKDKEA